jgi:hypothetical protein
VLKICGSDLIDWVDVQPMTLEAEELNGYHCTEFDYSRRRHSILRVVLIAVVHKIRAKANRRIVQPISKGEHKLFTGLRWDCFMVADADRRVFDHLFLASGDPRRWNDFRLSTLALYAR